MKRYRDHIGYHITWKGHLDSIRKYGFNNRRNYFAYSKQDSKKYLHHSIFRSQLENPVVLEIYIPGEKIVGIGRDKLYYGNSKRSYGKQIITKKFKPSMVKVVRL